MSEMQKDEVFHCNDSGRKEVTAAAALTQAVAGFDSCVASCTLRMADHIHGLLKQTLLSTSWNMCL